MPSQTPDPISALIALFALMAGPAVASIIGPYVVIALAALVAAGVALGRADAMPRWQALWFVLSAVFTALLLTVSLAQIVVRGINWGLHLDFSEAALLVPCALLIAGSRAYWWSAATWAANLLRRRAEGAKP